MVNDIERGSGLAKVLWYYNLIPDTYSQKQKIVCPFHEDVNPSMIVDLGSNSFYCFGCGLSGDDLKFAMLLSEKINNTNDLQGCKNYIKILSSKKASSIKFTPSHKSFKPMQRELYNEAYDYYHGLKKINWRHSGDSDVDIVKSYMTERGFSEKVLNECDAKITYNKSYPIIFPMLDNGVFKGWVSRTTTKLIEKKRKYLYNEGFSRATTLVGDYGSEKYVFVVEGYMDRLKFIMFGEKNVVAILGWKMSQNQIQKLKDKGVTTVISALDNDTCGKKGTEYLKNYFEVVRFKYLKNIKDPGEMKKPEFDKMLNKTKQDLEKLEERKNGISRQNQKRRPKIRTKQR